MSIKNILLIALLLIVDISAICLFKESPKKNEEVAPPVITNFGITVDDFVKQYNEIAHELEVEAIVIDNSKLKEVDDSGYFYSFEGYGVVLTLDKDSSTNFISKISVICQPFNNKTKSEKTFILLFQTTVFWCASMIFNENMYYQSYREGIIKQLYSTRNKGYMYVGDLKCESFQKDDDVILAISPKD